MILNAFSKALFWLRIVDEKRSGDDRCSIDRSRERRAIFFDENALFILQFQLINLQHLGIDVCGDDQGRANAEKVNRADRADGTDEAKVNGANGVDGVDKADNVDGADGGKANRADRADKDKANGGGVHIKEPDKVDRADRSKADRGRANGVDGGRADIKKSDRADRGDEDGADIIKPDRSDTAAGDPGLGDLQVKG